MAATDTPTSDFPLLHRACGGTIRIETVIALRDELDRFIAMGRQMFGPAEPANPTAAGGCSAPYETGRDCPPSDCTLAEGGAR